MIRLEDTIVSPDKSEIFISETNWIFFNNFCGKTEIIKAISDAIEKYDIPLPIREITLVEAEEDFKALRELDALSLIKRGEMFTKYEYEWTKRNNHNTYIDLCRVGNKASDYFHQENRWKCDSINSPSPYRSWTTEKFRLNWLKNLWTMETTKVDTTRLRSALSLRNYVASQFRPSAAKAMYTYLQTTNAIDFSAGWGDRLAGFMASFPDDYQRTYFGVDPNSLLHHNGYGRQIRQYNTWGANGAAGLIEACAEDTIYFSQYDTVFTSPPYFDSERYTQEANQSWKKFKYSKSRGCQDWLEGFLFKAISSSWSTLKIGGTMAINIADTYAHHTVNKVCDPMNDYISTLAGAEYLGMMGYRMAKRPNSESDKAGIYVEPIWMWKKR